MKHFKTIPFSMLDSSQLTFFILSPLLLQSCVTTQTSKIPCSTFFYFISYLLALCTNQRHRCLKNNNNKKWKTRNMKKQMKNVLKLICAFVKEEQMNYTKFKPPLLSKFYLLPKYCTFINIILKSFSFNIFLNRHQMPEVFSGIFCCEYYYHYLQM